MKLSHLESLRGLAALAVVASHLVWAFATPPQPANPKASEWPAGLARLPEPARTLGKVGYWCAKSGRAPVFVFFALSGLVLSRSYLLTGSGSHLSAGVFRRWPRLAIPATAAMLLAWGATHAGFRHTSEAASAIRDAGVSPFWLDLTAPPRHGVWTAFRLASYDLYFHATPLLPSELDNIPLWTMRVEFHGSLLVFAFLGVFGGHRRRLALSAGGTLLLGLLGLIELGLFLGGIALSVVLVERPNWKWPTWLGVTLLIAGLYLGGSYGGYDGREPRMPFLGTPFRPGEVRVGIGALLIVAAVALTPRIARLLSARLARRHLVRRLPGPHGRPHHRRRVADGPPDPDARLADRPRARLGGDGFTLDPRRFRDDAAGRSPRRGARRTVRAGGPRRQSA